MQDGKAIHEQGIRFPRDSQGRNKGELHWVRRHRSRILQVLHNPLTLRIRLRCVSALAFCQTKAQHDESSRSECIVIPMSISATSPGAVEANQKRLAENALGLAERAKRGQRAKAPRFCRGASSARLRRADSIHYGMASSGAQPMCAGSFDSKGREGLPAAPGLSLIRQSVTCSGADAAADSGGCLAVQQEVEARITETDTCDKACGARPSTN